MQRLDLSLGSRDCSKCSVHKPYSEFVTVRARGRVQPSAKCLACFRVDNRAYYHANPDKEKQRRIVKYAKSTDTRQEWRKKNVSRLRALGALRKRRVRHATPPWANIPAIYAFMRACPVGYHIDHIIPIKGQNVSGLHVLENLQYLPASANISKKNKVIDEVLTMYPTCLIRN